MATFISNKGNGNSLINLDFCELIEQHNKVIHFYFNSSVETFKIWKFASEGEAIAAYNDIQEITLPTNI